MKQFSVIYYNNLIYCLKSTSMNSFFSKVQDSQFQNLPMFQAQGPFYITKKADYLNLSKYVRTWTDIQEVKLATFLHKNQARFVFIGKAEKWELFRCVCKFIRSRNLTQCKNFFTQIILKYNSIPAYIQSLKQRIQSFQKKFQEESENLKLFLNEINQNSKNSIQKNIKQLLPTDIVYIKPLRTVHINENQQKKLCSLPKGAIRIFYPQLLINKQKDQNEYQQMLINWSYNTNQLIKMQ